MVLAPTVDNTAMHLSKKLHLNVVSSETSIQKVQQMGQLLKSGLIGNRSLEGKALEMKVENVQSISALARKEDDGPFLFKMGSTQCKSEVGVLKKERKVVKVANKCRKQDLARKLVPSVLVLGEGGRKRKLEDGLEVEHVQTKKVMLFNGVPEVVGAAGLPDHEQ
ncbi:hypothetical protein M0R45_008628 [Rubus argutus]|uniref:Uncharacterized protein n=1 Tax=Rubus argutus TaxID=59490 RepID=A0AAW1Y3M1_RUBAR